VNFAQYGLATVLLRSRLSNVKLLRTLLGAPDDAEVSYPPTDGPGLSSRATSLLWAERVLPPAAARSALGWSAVVLFAVLPCPFGLRQGLADMKEQTISRVITFVNIGEAQRSPPHG
jgi:hypothetical protein